MKKQNRIVILITIFLLITAQNVLSEDGFSTRMPDTGKPFLNGRYWEKLPEIGKTMFLSGILDGVYFTTRFISQENRKEFVHDVVCSLKVGEISVLMDEFYKDKYNVNLPIIIAYSIVVDKANGATPEEIEKNISLQRKYWQ